MAKHPELAQGGRATNQCELPLEASVVASHLRLLQFADHVGDPCIVERFRQKAEHCQNRIRMRQPGRWRLPLIVGELIRAPYGKHSLGWKSLAQDLVL